ncbi:MAG TPA: L-lactate dehydrogenase [Phycisphaerae bacterium]|nr:L-lactate dehydrogenase [Phycisphaerae bacterium]HRY67713.1 L-lactate dehydrogenase [Phycisphaerae bacterium]HSA25165.1 L-lactate dehydrogenase [Phycisphaerae bacterium]
MSIEPDSTAAAAGRIAIIGAGSVGSTIAYATMLRGLASQIVLIDQNRAKGEAEAKDLDHGRRFVPTVRLWAGDVADCAEAEIVIVTAGAKQKPGQSRLDLIQANVAVFSHLIPAISEVAPNAILLIVSNPVDVLTYQASKLHHGGPERVLGSGTVLDSARLVSLLAERLGVAPRSVHAYVVGEHGDSKLLLWSSADIGATPLRCMADAKGGRLTATDRTEINAQVEGAAGEIIEAKGATNWAVGLAVARIIEAIRRDESAVLTVSRLLENYFGVSDVCMSVPCLVNRHGARRVLPVPMNAKELAAFQASARILREACRSAGL